MPKKYRNLFFLWNVPTELLRGTSTLNVLSVSRQKTPYTCILALLNQFE